MTLRVYKDEYMASQIAYLSNAFDVVEETATMLTISGEQDDLEKVMSGMFCTEAEFKSIFPKFVTEQERKAYTEKAYQDAKTLIQTQLLQIINHGVINETFFKLREIYNAM